MSDPSLLTYYARRAAEYERIYQKPERQDDLRVLADRLRELFTSRRILEIACGTGYWTERIAPAAQHIVASDANEEVLEIAGSKPYPTARVDFTRADAFDLSTISGTFDAAFAGFWWSHLKKSELASFLHQLDERLEPRSLVAFIDNRYVEGSSTPISRVDEEGNSYQLRRLDDGSEHEVLKNFPSEEELRAAAGPREAVTIELHPYYWLLSYRTP